MPTQVSPAVTGSTRGGRTPRDMAMSLAVLLVPVFLLFVGYNVLFNGDHPRAVDVSGSYADARHSAHFTVLEPAGLPDGWATISGTFARTSEGSTLRIGYATPSRTGLQLVESDRPVNALLPAELGTDARPGNLVAIGDQRWRPYPQARGGNQALVLAGDGRTIIIIGTASMDDLRILASSLR